MHRHISMQSILQIYCHISYNIGRQCIIYNISWMFTKSSFNIFIFDHTLAIHRGAGLNINKWLQNTLKILKKQEHSGSARWVLVQGFFFVSKRSYVQTEVTHVGYGRGMRRMFPESSFHALSFCPRSSKSPKRSSAGCRHADHCRKTTFSWKREPKHITGQKQKQIVKHIFK